jgi:hypothetical protein
MQSMQPLHQVDSVTAHPAGHGLGFVARETVIEHGRQSFGVLLRTLETAGGP